MLTVSSSFCVGLAMVTAVVGVVPFRLSLACYTSWAGGGGHCRLHLLGVGLWPFEFVSFRVTCHHFRGCFIPRTLGGLRCSCSVLWYSALGPFSSFAYAEGSRWLFPFPRLGCP